MGKRGRPPHPDILTPREWEVLDLLREGLSNEQIAERLGISLAGAKYHVSEILSKLGVASREEAARWSPERRPWWAGALAPVTMLWRKASPSWVAGTAAAGVFVLIAIGIGVLVWGLVRTDVVQDDKATGSRPERYVFEVLGPVSSSKELPAKDIAALVIDPISGGIYAITSGRGNERFEAAFAGSQSVVFLDTTLYRYLIDLSSSPANVERLDVAWPTPTPLPVAEREVTSRSPDGQWSVVVENLGRLSIEREDRRSAILVVVPDRIQGWRTADNVRAVSEREPLVAELSLVAQWSPTGNLLVLTERQQRGYCSGLKDASDLFLIDPSSAMVVNLTSDVVSPVADFSWRPDGESIHLRLHIAEERRAQVAEATRESEEREAIRVRRDYGQSRPVPFELDIAANQSLTCDSDTEVAWPHPDYREKTIDISAALEN